MAWLALEIGLFFGICFGVLIGVLYKHEDMEAEVNPEQFQA
jgi:uncharacterized membrane-anchored protein YhcB (DUF1043 family)